MKENRIPGEGRNSQQGSQPVGLTADAAMPDDAALDAIAGDFQPKAFTCLLGGSQPEPHWFLEFDEFYYYCIVGDLQDLKSQDHKLKHIPRELNRFKSQLFKSLFHSCDLHSDRYCPVILLTSAYEASMRCQVRNMLAHTSTLNGQESCHYLLLKFAFREAAMQRALSQEDIFDLRTDAVKHEYWRNIVNKYSVDKLNAQLLQGVGLAWKGDQKWWPFTSFLTDDDLLAGHLDEYIELDDNLEPHWIIQDFEISKIVSTFDA